MAVRWPSARAEPGRDAPLVDDGQHQHTPLPAPLRSVARRPFFDNPVACLFYLFQAAEAKVVYDSGFYLREFQFLHNHLSLSVIYLLLHYLHRRHRICPCFGHI